MKPQGRDMDAESRVYQTLIIGAGPAGMGPLINAAQRGQLNALLDSGVAILDRGTRIGGGTIGRYLVNSDSYAKVFLACLDTAGGAKFFQDVLHRRPAQILRRFGDQHAPLSLVGKYLDGLGSVLQRHLDTSARSRFFPRTRGISVHLTDDGVRVHATTQAASGQLIPRVLRARSVVLAIGGYQRREDALGVALTPGLQLTERHADKMMLTGELLTLAGLSRALTRLRTAGSAKVVIIGGSHSALSAAWALLYGPPAHARFPFQEGDIYILHRREIRVYYPSVQEAQADGYTGFTADDLCLRTQRLHRLGGLRGDGRQLYRQVVGLAGNPVESRVRLRSCSEYPARPLLLQRLVDEAALIVPAFGYRPQTIPIYGPDGKIIPLGSGDGRPLVDSRCRILRQDGCAIAGLFGIGLASGFLPDGALGGEASFRGQANGVWLYQNDAGGLILEQILPLN